MGAGGSGISEETQSAMLKKQTDLIASFGINFVLAYRLAVVNKCKADAEGAVDEMNNTRKLPDAEVPNYPVYEGTVHKSAPSNWFSYKERHMVAMSEGSNYAINYFTKKDGGELKGSINCRPLNCEKFNSVEREEHPFGVKLVPVHSWDLTARTWYFRVENKEAEDGWYEALKNACYHARAPLDRDQPVIAEAFTEALKALCKSESVYQNFDDYTEKESLSKFCFYIIDREFLRPEFAKIEMPMGKEAMESAVRKAMYLGVSTAVSVAWVTFYTAASAVTDKVTSVVGAQMQPIIDAEANLMTQISEITERTVGAAMKDLTQKLFATTMKTLGLPIGTAFSEVIKGFDTYMKKEVIGKVAGLGPNELNALQKKTDQQSNYSWYGPMKEAITRSREIPTLIQDDGAFKDGTGMTPSSLDYMVRGAVCKMYRNAVSKFFAMTRGGSTDPAATLSIVTGEFIHDAPEVVQDLYFEIFGECLRTNPLYLSLIANPINTAVQPVADVITAIPVVGEMIDIMGTVDKCLESFLQSTMSPSIAECIGDKYLNSDALIKATGCTPCVE